MTIFFFSVSLSGVCEVSGVMSKAREKNGASHTCIFNEMRNIFLRSPLPWHWLELTTVDGLL